MKKKTIILTLCLVLLFLSANTLYAADDGADVSTGLTHNVSKQVVKTDTQKTLNDIVYVDANSKSKTEDGTKKSPYKTISDDNLEKISDKSTVYVSKGTYNLQSLTINKSISFVGENTNNVIFTSNEKSSIFTVEKDANVNFINFTVRDFSSDTSAAITNNGNLIIENLYLASNIGTTRSTKGGSILNNGDLTVKNCIFENNTASWGAAIYNTNNAKIFNSKFKKNSIYNVGGAIYSLRGNLTVYNSRFSDNRAVSGAAIYNAAGFLYTDNTEFYNNDAEKFFGGAIYSTGITVTNNSQFYLNHATKDGGAITNTNNFTIINCIFEQNSAEENGGTIENVPWSQNENGNLTIINSTFTENSAGNYGGVIINYDKKERVGDPAVITARNCVFDSNTAYVGGVVYNQQYIDFEANVIVNNDAEKSKIIYSKEKLVKSIDNNWWGTNSPKKSSIGVMPKTWIVLKFTNTTALVSNMTTKLQVSLNTLSTGKKTKIQIPERVLTFNADKTVFNPSVTELNSIVNTVVQPLGDTLSVVVDNQRLSLKPVNANVSYTLTNKNTTLQIKVQLPKNVNGKISIKVNSKTLFDKKALKNGLLTLKYDIPNNWTNSKYYFSVVLNTNDGMLFKTASQAVTIPKRKVTSSFSIVNTTEIKAGAKIKLVATIKLANRAVNDGTVSFKVNNKVIKSKLKLVNGKATYTYKIPMSVTSDTLDIAMTYSGDANKYSSKMVKSVTLRKYNVHTTLKNRIVVSRNASKKITVKLLDDNDKRVTYGYACYKINGVTVETNIVITNGVFSFTYNAPSFGGASMTQTLTIRFGANSLYNSFTKNVELFIK